MSSADLIEVVGVPILIEKLSQEGMLYWEKATKALQTQDLTGALVFYNLAANNFHHLLSCDPQAKIYLQDALDKIELLQRRLADSGNSDGGNTSNGGGTNVFSVTESSLGCVNVRNMQFSEDNCMTFDDIAGLQNAKDKILNGVLYPILYPRLYTSRVRNLLFYGPPGTGKTLLAKAMSVELQRLGQGQIQILFFAPTGLKGRYYGDTEKNIHNYFDCASKLACQCASGTSGSSGASPLQVLSIIFLDEIDSLASRRNVEDPASSSSVGALLAELDGLQSNSNILVVGATNFPWQLDEAVVRRFDDSIFVDLPDVQAIQSLLSRGLVKNIQSIIRAPQGLVCAGEAKVRESTSLKCFNPIVCKRSSSEDLQIYQALWDLIVQRCYPEEALTPPNLFALATIMHKKRYSSSDVASTIRMALRDSAARALVNNEFIQVGAYSRGGTTPQAIEPPLWLSTLCQPSETPLGGTVSPVKYFSDQSPQALLVINGQPSQTYLDQTFIHTDAQSRRLLDVVRSVPQVKKVWVDLSLSNQPLTSIEIIPLVMQVDLDKYSADANGCPLNLLDGKLVLYLQVNMNLQDLRNKIASTFQRAMNILQSLAPVAAAGIGVGIGSASLIWANANPLQALSFLWNLPSLINAAATTGLYLGEGATAVGGVLFALWRIRDYFQTQLTKDVNALVACTAASTAPLEEEKKEDLGALTQAIKEIDISDYLTNVYISNEQIEGTSGFDSSGGVSTLRKLKPNGLSAIKTLFNKQKYIVTEAVAIGLEDPENSEPIPSQFEARNKDATNPEKLLTPTERISMTTFDYRVQDFQNAIPQVNTSLNEEDYKKLQNYSQYGQITPPVKGK